MDSNSLNERLSQIDTWSTMLLQANAEATQQREQARAWLVERYEKVVRRYLIKPVGAEGAAELVQEFAGRMLEGRYRNVDKSIGRFRDYLKTCLFSLVADYRKKQAQTKAEQLPDQWEPADHRTNEDADEEWRLTWRQDLIDRTLESLKRLDRRQDQFLYPVLRLRMDQPDLTSEQAAAVLSERIGKPVSDGWLRKKLMQARQRFADLLMEEVARSVNPPTLERVTDELTDLNLLHYCGSLQKRHA